MTLKDKLFSFEGRLRRRDFWLLSIVLTITNVVAQTLVKAALASQPAPVFGGLNASAIGVLAVVLVFLWPALAVGFKRAHDRNRPGWWLLVFYAVVLANDVLVLRVGPAAGQFNMLNIVFLVVMLVACLWVLIDLGILDGTPGPNRFGPSPKATEGVAAAA